MEYLDTGVLDGLDAERFREQTPYPWINPEGVLRQEALCALRENLPGIETFQTRIGETRRYGQKPHDRFALEYAEGLPLPSPWQEFVDELRDGPYRSLLCRLTGKPDMALRFHWHWATAGDSVSPHCDARRKLGSHVFYLNRETEWDPKWGGETLVLDDDGRLSRNSSPGFEDFSEIIHARATGNRSLLFTRRGNSWHGVSEIRCPAGHFRKVFIVVLEKPRLRSQLRRAFSGS